MRLLISFATALLLISCHTRQKLINDLDAKVDSILSLMNLEEKVGQLTLYTSDMDQTGAFLRPQYLEDIKAGKVGAIFNAYGSEYTRKLQKIAVEQTRLGIPLLFGYDVIHGHKTIFPIPLAEASSWDTTMIRLTAEIAADEASAMGLHWTFAPVCDISRDPRWGRVMEGAGEDPFLASKIVAARVSGFQKRLLQARGVLACVKHFAAYGAPQAGREYHTVDMSIREFRQTYLPPYSAAIKAGAKTVMTSFNDFDAIPATANKFLLTDVLRRELGFHGFVVTDYTAIMELIPHGVATDSAHAAELALKAGVDMDMQAGFFQSQLPNLVRKGKISLSEIDAAVKRILKIKFELGLFDNPYRFCDSVRQKNTLYKLEYLQTARNMAAQSIVLLKNNNNVLPLTSTDKTVALIGPLAHNRREMMGAWSAAGDWMRCSTVLEGLQAAMPNVQILYRKGCNISDDSTQEFQSAIQAAQKADKVILVVGEAANMSGEASSRSELGLPGVQQKLVEAIAKVASTKLICVVMSGRPLVLTDLEQKAQAILQAWFLGTMTGEAIADVVLGHHNPSGKLPMTFPRALGQIPIFYSAKNTGRPYDKLNKYTSKYIDVENTPLYPFGYGLSYTQFEYSKPKVQLSQNHIVITCQLTNTGAKAGHEVAQLYIRDWVGSVTRPVKELKGFQRIFLQPGQTVELKFTLNDNDLAFFRADMSWGTEPGEYSAFVGGNSDTNNEVRFYR